MSVTIRRFAEGDLLSCAKVFARVFSMVPWSEEWTPEKAQDYIQKAHGLAGSFGFVAVSGEELQSS
jgi:hypothetical protein